jgi:hypothetical protein
MQALTNAWMDWKLVEYLTLPAILVTRQGFLLTVKGMLDCEMQLIVFNETITTFLLIILDPYFKVILLKRKMSCYGTKICGVYL